MKQSDTATAFTLYGAYPVKEAEPILCTCSYRGDTGLHRLSISRIQKRTMEVWDPLGHQLSILWLSSGQLLSTFRSRDLQRYHAKTTDLLKESHQGKVRGRVPWLQLVTWKPNQNKKINKQIKKQNIWDAFYSVPGNLGNLMYSQRALYPFLLRT